MTTQYNTEYKKKLSANLLFSTNPRVKQFFSIFSYYIQYIRCYLNVKVHEAA